MNEHVSVRNAADEGQVSKAEKKIKSFDDMLEESIKFLVANAYGKVFLSWIYQNSNPFDNIMTGSSQTFYKAGESELGRKLFVRMNEIDPLMYGRFKMDTNRKEYGNG